MKENDFIRDYGLDEAKRVLHDARWCVSTKLWGKYEFKNDDLKRLVESWEFVESYGGLHGAKNTCKLLKSSLDTGLYHGMDNVDAVSEAPRLEQAIKDVESCQ